MERVITNPRFPQREVTLLRPAFGTMEGGIMPIEFDDDPVSISAVVQPAGGDDLDLLPEGERLKNIVAIWTTTPLYVANGKDCDSDVLEIDGVRYTVIKLLNRAPNGFCKVLAEGYVNA